MVELASALVTPIAKLLLKSWLGETGAAIGDNLLKLGFKRLGDWTKAHTAQQRAEQLARAVVTDLELFFARERVDENALVPAAFEAGETIERHLGAGFLIGQHLDAQAIEEALITARPPGQIFRSVEAEHGIYLRLIRAVAPRLRAVAPEIPGYELERDAALLGMAKVVDDAAQRLAAVQDAVQATREDVRQLLDRPRRLAEGYEADYLTRCESS